MSERNGKSRIFVPPGVTASGAEPPPYTPTAWLAEARDALRFHDGELAILERLTLQTPEVVALIGEHRKSRDRVLACFSRAYAIGAPKLMETIHRVAQAIEDNYEMAFKAPPASEAPRG